MEQVDRVIAYLEHCGDPDIEAGIGALLGIGSRERIAKFKQGLREALSESPPSRP